MQAFALLLLLLPSVDSIADILLSQYCLSDGTTTLQVTWTSSGTTYPTDWLGIYAEGDCGFQYCDRATYEWEYICGGKHVCSQGTYWSPKTITIGNIDNITDGVYRVYYFNNDNLIIGRSDIFSIQPACASITIAAPSSCVPIGTPTLNVTWSYDDQTKYDGLAVYVAKCNPDLCHQETRTPICGIGTNYDVCPTGTWYSPKTISIDISSLGEGEYIIAYWSWDGVEWERKGTSASFFVSALCQEVNVAYGKPVTLGPGLTAGVNNNGGVDDGLIDCNQWSSNPRASTSSCSTSYYVTIDLFHTHPLVAVTVWHYYCDSRIFCGQAVALSQSGAFSGEQVSVYNTGTSYGPAETAAGNKISFLETNARYVRHSLSRNNLGQGAYFLEVKAFRETPFGCTPRFTSPFLFFIQARCPQHWLHLHFTPCNDQVNITLLMESHVNLLPACQDWCVYDMYDPLSHGWIFNGSCWADGFDNFCYYDPDGSEQISATNAATEICGALDCTPLVTSNFLAWIQDRCPEDYLPSLNFAPCNDQVNITLLQESFANLRPKCDTECVHDMYNQTEGFFYNATAGCWEDVEDSDNSSFCGDSESTAAAHALSQLCAANCLSPVTENFLDVIQARCPESYGGSSGEDDPLQFNPCDNSVNITALLESHANLRPPCGTYCVYDMHQLLNGWSYNFSQSCWSEGANGYCFDSSYVTQRLQASHAAAKLCGGSPRSCSVEDGGNVFHFDSLSTPNPSPVSSRGANFYFALCDNVVPPPGCQGNYVAFRKTPGDCSGLGTLDSVVIWPFNSDSIRNASQSFHYTNGEEGYSLWINMICSRTDTSINIYEDPKYVWNIDWYNEQSCVPVPPPPANCQIQSGSTIFDFTQYSNALPDPVHVTSPNTYDYSFTVCQNVDPPLDDPFPCHGNYVAFQKSPYFCYGLGRLDNLTTLAVATTTQNAYQVFFYKGGEGGRQIIIRMRCATTVSQVIWEEPSLTYNVDWFTPKSCPKGCKKDASAYLNGNRSTCGQGQVFDTCVETCNAGYKGGGVRVCSQGKLSASTPCTLKAGFCGADHTTPSVGVLRGTCAVAKKTACTESCAVGYSKAAGTAGGSVTRACNAPSYAASTLKCVENSCSGDTSRYPNGNRATCTAATIQPGKTCTENCHPGYVGGGVRTCSKGQLSASTPCTKLGCAGDTSQYDNGNRNACSSFLPNGQSCTETCSTGYVGGGTRTCTNQQLSASNPCVSTGCAGDTTYYSYGARNDCFNYVPEGQSCTETCDQGYIGGGSRTCTNGQLTADHPCVLNASYCYGEAMSTVVGVDIGSCSLAKTDSCTEVCSSGFSWDGVSSAVRQCDPPHYEVSALVCLENNCSGDTTPFPNGNRNGCKSFVQAGVECTETCAAGYLGGGSRVCHHGTLIPPSIPCIKSTCPGLNYDHPFGDPSWRNADRDFPIRFNDSSHNVTGKIQWQQLKSDGTLVTLVDWAPLLNQQATLLTSQNPTFYHGNITLQVNYNGSAYFSACYWVINQFFFQLFYTGDYIVSDYLASVGSSVTYYSTTASKWQTANQFTGTFPLPNFLGWVAASDGSKPPTILSPPHTYNVQMFCKNSAWYPLNASKIKAETVRTYIGVVTVPHTEPLASTDPGISRANYMIVDTSNAVKGVGTVIATNIITDCSDYSTAHTTSPPAKPKK